MAIGTWFEYLSLELKCYRSVAPIFLRRQVASCKHSTTCRYEAEILAFCR